MSHRKLSQKGVTKIKFVKKSQKFISEGENRSFQNEPEGNAGLSTVCFCDDVKNAIVRSH